MEQLENKNEKIINEQIREFFFWIGILGVLYAILSVVYLNYPGANEYIPILKPIAEPGLKVGLICLSISVFALNLKKIAECIVSLVKTIAKKILYLLHKFIKWFFNSIKANLFKRKRNTVVNTVEDKKLEKNIYNMPLGEAHGAYELFNKHIQDDKSELVLNSLQKEAKTAIIKQCFQKYNLDFIKVKDVIEGPTITRYLLELGEGRLNAITSLEKELAMTLGVDRINIKPSARGLIFDVPNEKIKKVNFFNVYNNYIQGPSDRILEVPIGQTAIGELLTLDITKCPHLLIAGATNSGKSVCVNTIICSILLKATPEQVKFILIDPKQVELSDYEEVPHLLMPVIKEIDKAAGALNYVVKEMDRRYSLMKEMGARNIDVYNRKCPDDPLPYIIVVIDELADLIIQVKEDVLNAIQRLGQLARAAGIHVILATQRPSADIVEGRIKANIPGRIAFSVVSNTDSRVILDQAGAEKLLGFGDGLLLTTDRREPERFQGAYISDKEIEDIVTWCKEKYGICYTNQPKFDNIHVCNEVSENININKDLQVGYSDAELKVRVFLNKLAYNDENKDLIILPPSNELRDKIGIRKKDLLDIMSKMKEEGCLVMEGAGRGCKTYLNISVEEAYDFLHKYGDKVC